MTRKLGGEQGGHSRYNLTLQSYNLYLIVKDSTAKSYVNCIKSAHFKFLPAPDVPNFLGQYLIAAGTDYAQQTVGINAIDAERIGETSTPPTTLIRIVCYDQPIYDDVGLEMDEWLGLTLGVDRASVLTTVRPM